MGRVQHGQMVHVGVPEQIHYSLQGPYLPVDGVIVLLEQRELHDEAVVDGASALVLLHGDV